MKLPNLFIAGFPKCGTTSTAWVLHELGAAKLPDIELESEITWGGCQKEPALMQRGEEERNRLCEAHYGDETYRLDATASYIHDEKALKRIGELGAKVIILMRHPVERVISWWNHHQKELIEGDLRDHWRLPRGMTLDDLITEILAGNEEQDTILTGGLYHERIAELLKYNKKENVHFAYLEDFIVWPEKYFEQIYEFLLLDPPSKINLSVPINKGIGLSIPNPIVQRLERYYIETIRETEKIVGRVPASWKE